MKGIGVSGMAIHTTLMAVVMENMKMTEHPGCWDIGWDDIMDLLEEKNDITYLDSTVIFVEI